MSLNSERSALRSSPMRFASCISLEWAAALVFCDSVLDSELDSELDWAFEFIVFALELNWDPDVSEPWLSGIDAALAMSVLCVSVRAIDFSQHWLIKIKNSRRICCETCFGPSNGPSQVISQEFCTLSIGRQWSCMMMWWDYQHEENGWETDLLYIDAVSVTDSRTLS